jgi:hypothetical protein
MPSPLTPLPKGEGNNSLPFSREGGRRPDGLKNMNFKKKSVPTRNFYTVKMLGEAYE